MLYRLSYSWYEDYSPRLLEGPAVDNWSSYCDSLLPEAIKNAVTTAKANENWLGWDDIVDALVQVLQTKGYKLLAPDEKVYWGSNIIEDIGDSSVGQDSSILDKVKEHNKKFRAAMYKDMGLSEPG